MLCWLRWWQNVVFQQYLALEQEACTVCSRKFKSVRMSIFGSFLLCCCTNSCLIQSHQQQYLELVQFPWQTRLVLGTRCVYFFVAHSDYYCMIDVLFINLSVFHAIHNLFVNSATRVLCPPWPYWQKSGLLWSSGIVSWSIRIHSYSRLLQGLDHLVSKFEIFLFY